MISSSAQKHAFAGRLVFAKDIAADTLRRFNADGIPGGVQIEIVRDNNVNAFAKKYRFLRHGYLLGIHDATFLYFDEALQSFSKRLLEIDFRAGSAPMFKEDTILILERYNAHAILARLINQLATNFIVLHELAHVINGHLDFMPTLGLSEGVIEAYSDKAAPN